MTDFQFHVPPENLLLDLWGFVAARLESRYGPRGEKMGGTEATNVSCAPLDKPAGVPDPTRARLERVINDVISDHGLQGSANESAAGEFTRKVCVQILPANVIYMSRMGEKSRTRRLS